MNREIQYSIKYVFYRVRVRVKVSLTLTLTLNMKTCQLLLPLLHFFFHYMFPQKHINMQIRFSL